MVRYKYTPEAPAQAAAVARNITEVMRLPDGQCTVGHGTISTILREAGLNTVEARRSRLSELAGVA
ncbi:hypothetical protein [Micromonospora sp. NPDC049274]|uniref:hypothetical protein n=1 Tax=Micromonospora sp. NPDC049274 TaxID=3154829 RepID=UPI0034437DF1